MITRLRLVMMDWTGPDYLIARAAGITAPRLSNYQMGRQHIPAHHLLALARVLRVNPADIAGWASEEECPEIGIIDEAVM